MRIICAFIGIALFSIQSCADTYINQKLSYGSFLKKDGIEFRIHAPSSNQVQLIIFDNPEDQNGAAHEMSPDGNGDWTIFINGLGVGTIYGYKLSGPVNDNEKSSFGFLKLPDTIYFEYSSCCFFFPLTFLSSFS